MQTEYEFKNSTRMNGYEFTWLSAMKLLGGILLVAVWYMMRKQAMLDKKYREENEKAGQAHGSEPVPRIVERSNIIIAVAAMLLIIIVLIL